MKRRAPAFRTFWCGFNRFAVPATIFELLAQQLIRQRVVRLFEIRADGENSAVDAELSFAVKKRPVVERFKQEPVVDAVDHFAGLFVGGVEAEIHQDDKTVERNEQASIFIRSAPVTGTRLASKKLGSPAFSSDARALGRNRVGGFIGEVPHYLPADRRIGIEEPFEVR